MTPFAPAVRPAAQAGRFYDADPQRLRRHVETLLARAPGEPAARPPLGLLVPHAGYIYSGAIAACAYRRVQGLTIPRIVILAPSHYVDVDGAALPTHTAFETPLGRVPVDRDAVEALLAQPGFLTDDEAHAMEHAVEVHLPFLQVALAGEFSIVPAALGRCSPATLDAVTDGFEQWLRARAADGERWLLIASSDTYHGYDREACEANDRRLMELVGAMSTDELRQLAQGRRVMACGWQPLVVVMRLAERLGKGRAQVLRRGDSQSEQPHPGEYVVGYLAAAFD